MRTWRVGTISMGVSLLFLGVFLLLSQMMGLSLTHIMISWWPIILIVLGAEILTYLFISRKEKPFLKYDFLSIIFVGVIGMVGIGFALLSSLGIVDLVNDAMTREERTYDLPTLSQKLDDDIKRVVINAEDYPIHVEGTTSQEVSLFGTYTATLPQGQSKLISEVEDYISVNQKGDTLFLDLKDLPSNNGPLTHYYPRLETTLLIPEHIQFELIGQDNSISLKPRGMKSNWTIENANDIRVFVEETSDIEITGEHVHEFLSEDGEWTVSSQEKNKDEFDEESLGYKNGRFKIGEGTHSINIMKAYQVSLSTSNK